MVEFHDYIFKRDEFTHLRETVRVIALDKGQFAFLKIEGEDEFGVRSHIETIGGGLELNESHEEAIRREVLEETGRDCRILAFIEDILDEYYLINRKTLSHFYLVELLNVQQPVNYQGSEKNLIKGVILLNKEEVLKRYQHHNPHNIEALIYQRDAHAFNEYLKGTNYEEKRD